MSMDATSILAQELGKTLNHIYQTRLRRYITRDVLYRHIRTTILTYNNRAPADDDVVKCSFHAVRQWFQGRSRPNSLRKTEGLIQALQDIVLKKSGEPLDPHTIATIRELCMRVVEPAKGPPPPGAVFHNLPRRHRGYEVARPDVVVPALRALEAANHVPLLYLRGLRNMGTSVGLYQLCLRYLDPTGRNKLREKPFSHLIYINAEHEALSLVNLTTQLQEELTGQPVSATTPWTPGYLQQRLADEPTLIAIDDFCYQESSDPVLKFLKNLRYPSVAVVTTDNYGELFAPRSNVATVTVPPLSFEAARVVAARYFEAQRCPPKKMVKDPELRALYDRVQGIPGLLLPLLQELCRGERIEQILSEPLLHFASFRRELAVMFQAGWARITAHADPTVYTLLKGLRDHPAITDRAALQAETGMTPRQFRDAHEVLVQHLWMHETTNDGGIDPHPMLPLFLKTVAIP